MPSPDRLESALRAAADFRSFAVGLLRNGLGWQLDPEAARAADVGYEWSEDEAGTAATNHKAKAYELQMLGRDQQPWGIFLLEFDEPRVFETRGLGTPLRAVLRRLVASRRKEANLPSWRLDNILFICTHNYQQYVFAMFRDTFGTGRVNEAKLATFGWQKGQPYRTVVTENLPHLVWPEDTEDKPAWVKAWAAAFDKEPLTRRFFVEFDKALELIGHDLAALGPTEAYSRAQLLLERLIFLYFVQNRGWLNQNARFLREGFEPHRARPDDCSYYEEFLEKLFWSLSSAGSTPFDRWDYVPFLNGGLFNDDEFEPSPKRRRDNPPLPIRNATFARVFDDFLETFNFTVREDTPLNQEVAVDPEMLGKVFESIVLHAESADPDAVAPDKRKATGSYYTPRIVVHFICREVLYQWLQPRLAGADWPQRLRQLVGLDPSDGLDREELVTLKQLLSPEEGTRLLELVKPLRCCDPAVGSGAFMVGLLHELTNLRRLAQTAANGYVDPVAKDRKWLHQTKADIIENCLFGVDIQQQAIEICMLRLWLSLVVDYDLGVDPFQADRKRFCEAIAEISQLPNLEMNFRRGDSLHDHICGVPVVILPGRENKHQKLFDTIHRLGERLHKAKSWDFKRKLRLEILEKRLTVSEAVIEDELKELRQKDSTLAGMFGESKSEAESRKRIAHETEQLEGALKALGKARTNRARLEAKRVDPGFKQKLRKLEGASFDAPFNFAWRIDFPQVFYPDSSSVREASLPRFPSPLKGEGKGEGGFDIIVGNPPFVTARNPKKRELYRERWQPYCHMKYHLLVPFFPLSFGLLKPGGELGFIVSNAFAKREFGKPLVEQFFTKIDLQKVVDCSGLMFPGHGTPTCLLFGANTKPNPKAPIRIAALLPGGGDLRTPPEESKVWHTLEQQHDSVGYSDAGVAVAGLTRKDMAQHPWKLGAGAAGTLTTLDTMPARLSTFIEGEVGVCTMTNADPLFIITPDIARRNSLSAPNLLPFQEGDEVRNWSLVAASVIALTYDTTGHILSERELGAHLLEYLRPFKPFLESRLSFGNKTFKQLGRPWYAYERMNANKYSTPRFITFCEIATHGHFVYWHSPRIFERDSPVIKLPSAIDEAAFHAASALLNSSAALFWLKQVCFCKRESEQPEKDTYYVFAGGKVEQLPVPDKVAQALRGEWNPLAKRLAELAEECWKRGQVLPRLAMKKLFEKPGEAYHEWNSSLPGYEKPHSAIGRPFGSAEELRQAYDRVVAERERLRSEMIALQEEMDWLVYAAYGLLPEDHPAVGFGPSPLKGEGKGDGLPEPLDKDHRPYRLWQKAEGDFAKATGLIPSDLTDRSNRLWRERLAAIRDNEHIRRIEQPVYKRRWDEQWKVKNRWECGEVAYQQELADAFEWWMAEKAEWYLEHKKDGGPVELGDWVQALWRDSRVQAAVEVVAPASVGIAGFTALLRSVVDSETVPDGIPFARSWEELEKRHARADLNKARRIRGKLNVPRERFHLVSKGVYKWAGLLFK
jgi:hypothetical protein